MSDDEFLNYVEFHCETPRARFSAEHIERLFRLAEVPMRWGGSRPVTASMYPPEAKPLVARARERLIVH